MHYCGKEDIVSPIISICSLAQYSGYPLSHCSERVWMLYWHTSFKRLPTNLWYMFYCFDRIYQIDIVFKLIVISNSKASIYQSMDQTMFPIIHDFLCLSRKFQFRNVLVGNMNVVKITFMCMDRKQCPSWELPLQK
mgnify:FL=1